MWLTTLGACLALTAVLPLQSKYFEMRAREKKENREPSPPKQDEPVRHVMILVCFRLNCHTIWAACMAHCWAVFV